MNDRCARNVAIRDPGFYLVRWNWRYMEERFCGPRYFPGEYITRLMTSSHSRMICRQRQCSYLAAFQSWYMVNSMKEKH